MYSICPSLPDTGGVPHAIWWLPVIIASGLARARAVRSWMRDVSMPSTMRYFSRRALRMSSAVKVVSPPKLMRLSFANIPSVEISTTIQVDRLLPKLFRSSTNGPSRYSSSGFLSPVSATNFSSRLVVSLLPRLLRVLFFLGRLRVMAL